MSRSHRNIDIPLPSLANDEVALEAAGGGAYYHPRSPSTRHLPGVTGRAALA
jgi:hypothetical protein